MANLKARRKSKATNTERDQLDFISGDKAAQSWHGLDNTSKTRAHDSLRTTQYEKEMIEKARLLREKETGMKISRQQFLHSIVMMKVKDMLQVDD